MEDYRTLAKLRYEKHKQEQDNILEAEKQKELDQERKIRNDNLIIDTIIFEITELTNNLLLDFSPDNILISCTEILSIMTDNIILFTNYARINELQNLVINLINTINSNLEQKTSKQDGEFVKQVSEIIYQMTKIIELDIDIELMDTTGDAEFAKEIEENYKEELNIKDIEYAQKLNTQFVNNLSKIDEKYIKSLFK